MDNRKIPKYCANCGKPMFKWWISKRTETCIFLKMDVICNREECRAIDDSPFNNVELKIDLNPAYDGKAGVEVTA